MPLQCYDPKSKRRYIQHDLPDADGNYREYLEDDHADHALPPGVPGVAFTSAIAPSYRSVNADLGYMVDAYAKCSTCGAPDQPRGLRCHYCLGLERVSA